jgi:hypothetical protein
MITGKNFRKAGLLIGTLTCGLMLALAVGHHFITKKIIVKVAPAPKVQLPEYDTALFNRFNTALRSIAVDSVAKTFSGILDITDGRDSINNVHALPLLVSTGGNKRYFRIGSTETILQQGMCIVIENDQKRVIVTRQTTPQTNILDNLQLLKSGLRTDRFVMVTKRMDNERVISFVNDHHINCKEFSVTYDTTTNKLTRLYARLTDIEDPLNKKKDRVMDLHIQRINNTVEFGEYPGLHTIIKQDGKNAALSAKYEGYKLVIL